MPDLANIDVTYRQADVNGGLHVLRSERREAPKQRA
jgi:hypothetical protein